MGIQKEAISEVAAGLAASLFSGSQEDIKQAQLELKELRIKSRTSVGGWAGEILQEVESQTESLRNDLNSR